MKEELIEKYFEKNLSPAESAEFEALLQSDTNFKATFDFELQLKKAIHAAERAKIKAQLQQVEKNRFAKDFKIAWYWAVAATVVITIGSYFMFFKKANPQELYVDNYQVFPNAVAPSVRDGNETNTDSSSAFKYYDAEKYLEAAGMFSEIFEKNQAEYALFYQIQCYLALGDTQKAIDLLLNASFTDGKVPYNTLQKWYLAMAYLKQNEIETAKLYLELLTNYENIQKQKAEQLLKAIN